MKKTILLLLLLSTICICSTFTDIKPIKVNADINTTMVIVDTGVVDNMQTGDNKPGNIQKTNPIEIALYTGITITIIAIIIAMIIYIKHKK